MRARVQNVPGSLAGIAAVLTAFLTLGCKKRDRRTVARAGERTHEDGPRIAEAVGRVNSTSRPALAPWRAVLARSPGGLSHKPPGLGGFGGREPRSAATTASIPSVSEASRARCALSPSAARVNAPPPASALFYASGGYRALLY